MLPAARRGGRPRTTNIRAVLNAIFYLLRTGCDRRLLSREFPGWSTVYHYFRAWKNAGVWTCIHGATKRLTFVTLTDERKKIKPISLQQGQRQI